MADIIQFITCLYSGLMRLYPHSFRAEFEGEMRAVFTDAVTEAASRGGASLASVCLRELGDYPFTLLHEHLFICRQRKDLMPDEADPAVGWAFWLQWVLVSIGGGMLGLGAAILVALVVHEIVGGLAEDRVPSAAMFGIGLGITQWLVLRGRMPRAGRWIWVSIVGSIAAYVLDRFLSVAVYAVTEDVLGRVTSLRITWLVSGLAFGTCLGMMQWPVLRRHVCRSEWWVIASIGGWVIAKAGNWVIRLLPVSRGVSIVVEGLLFWVVPPAITGLGLVLLSKRLPSDAPGLGPRVT